VSLGRSRADQAIVCLSPDSAADLHVLLHCDDFGADLSAHRLWFAWGNEWQTELKALFAERPGLVTPAQFIRLPVTPADEVERLVAGAQSVFAEVNAARSDALARGRDAWRPPKWSRPRLCVVAPSHFRLWDDAGAVLAETLRGASGADADMTCFDPDRPTCSSSLALRDAARDCDAVISADTSRADLPGVMPAEMPWLTWVTRADRIPAFVSASRRDGLVLADSSWRSPAADAGWPSGRITVGGWPPLEGQPITTPPPVLAVVEDTRPLAMPETLAEFSSHQMLWERVADELALDPFALGDGPGAYLDRRMRRLGVSAEGFDAALFLERLILPACAQSIVRLLLRESLPVRLYGTGWDQIEEFIPHFAGRVGSRADLVRLRDAAAAFVLVSPTQDSHPMHRLGRPVLSSTASSNRQRFIRAARDVLAGARDVLAGATVPLQTQPVSMLEFLALL
jgi:hypothetical protein